MVQQLIRKDSSWSPLAREKISLLVPRPLAVQAQQNLHKQPTHKATESKSFSQNVESAARLGHHFADIPVYPPEAPALTPVQRKQMMDDESAASTEQRPNQTGLPDQLKAGIEHLSGFSLDNVTVHYNSNKPAQLNALAYTQGTDIHVAPGQERHLPHEAWHVIQQAQGRVKPTVKMKQESMNDDPALEKEADIMGAKTAHGETGELVRARISPGIHQNVIQPKLGLELEMLVLTDIAGRPAPEKVLLGTYGNLDLVVDRNPNLVGNTPKRAALAPIRRMEIPAPPSEKGTKPVVLGKYDLPTNYRSKRVITMGFDPRPKRVQLKPLSERNLVARPVWQERVLDLGIKEYITWADNWEEDLAQASLTKLIALSQKMLKKYPTLEDRIYPIVQEAEAHLTKWKQPSLKRAKWEEQLVIKVSPSDREEWSTKHPVAEGLTGEGYDSIVEIVTKAYDPENEQGSRVLLADMTKAAELAGKIEAKTEGFTKRVPLESVGVTAKTRSAFVGNENMVTGIQRTDASIQSTLAVDLKELHGFFLVGMGGFKGGGFKEERTFKIKHQSIADVAKEVGLKAPQAAIRVLIDLQPKDRVPSNLLGLLTLMCQYLLMGAKFEEPESPQLDKNAVSLLSRTDLAKIYKVNVPEVEKEWVTPRLQKLQESLLKHTHRQKDDLLLTPAKYPPLPQVTRKILCGDFINNIFSQESDGFTPHLDEGIFKQMGPEIIPGRPETGKGVRTAPVFELRNMIPRAGDRFPKDQWVPLTQDLVALLTKLNEEGFWKGLGL